MISESDEDSWQPKEYKYDMFNKMECTLTNEQIQKRLQEQLSQPNYIENNYMDEEDEEEELFQKKTQKVQALYDPLQDDFNEQWMLQKHKTLKKPLTCPSCFVQIAFDYHELQNDQFVVQKPQNIVVNQTKIIRNPNASECMKFQNLLQNQKQTSLNEREQEINVKIVCNCECGIDIGYYDVNRQNYVMINVV